MQMSLDLNGDGGRHNAQLETEREKEVVGERLDRKGGEDGEKKKKKRLMPTWAKPVYKHAEPQSCMQIARHISKFSSLSF